MPARNITEFRPEGIISCIVSEGSGILDIPDSPNGVIVQFRNGQGMNIDVDSRLFVLAGQRKLKIIAANNDPIFVTVVY